MRLVVIGAGIAGSSTARLARAAGADVTVIADGREHSRAAAALLRSAYHRKRPGEARLFARSLELYAQWGIRLASGGWVTNYRTPDRAPRLDPDWYLVDPAAPLIEPDITGRAIATRTGVTVEGRAVAADAVVWCTGAATGGGITYGVTWIHPEHAALVAPDRLRVHHFAPYKTIAAGTAGHVARLGSSSARSEGKAYEQANKMLHIAADAGLIQSPHGWRPVAGQRCKLGPTGPVGIHWTFPCLHRTGYGLAPGLADDIVLQLGHSGGKE